MCALTKGASWVNNDPNNDVSDYVGANNDANDNACNNVDANDDASDGWWWCLWQYQPL